MSKFNEAIEVMKRIENNSAAKEAKKSIKGTFIMEDEVTIYSSFDNTTTQALSKSLRGLALSCSNCARNVDPADDVQFIRVNYEGGDSCCNEVMLAPEGDVQIVVVQEHQLRDLRIRSPMNQEPRDIKGFRHDQKNYFYPSLDELELNTTTTGTVINPPSSSES